MAKVFLFVLIVSATIVSLVLCEKFNCWSCEGADCLDQDKSVLQPCESGKVCIDVHDTKHPSGNSKKCEDKDTAEKTCNDKSSNRDCYTCDYDQCNGNFDDDEDEYSDPSEKFNCWSCKGADCLDQDKSVLQPCESGKVCIDVHDTKHPSGNSKKCEDKDTAEKTCNDKSSNRDCYTCDYDQCNGNFDDDEDEYSDPSEKFNCWSCKGADCLDQDKSVLQPCESGKVCIDVHDRKHPSGNSKKCEDKDTAEKTCNDKSSDKDCYTCEYDKCNGNSDDDEDEYTD